MVLSVCITVCLSVCLSFCQSLFLTNMAVCLFSCPSVSRFSIGHVRYINILTWFRCFRVKIANFSSFFCLSIPKGDLDTNKNNTKYRSLTRKPRSHVRILIYRTWPIGESVSQPVSQSINQRINQPVSLAVSQPITSSRQAVSQAVSSVSQSVGRSVGQSVCQSVGWSVCQSQSVNHLVSSSALQSVTCS